MKIGSYKEKKINFNEWEVSKLPITLWNKNDYAHVGCGYNLLASLVNKERPYRIRDINQRRVSCEKRFFLSYLRKNGFKVLELSKCNLSNKKKEVLTLMGDVNARHVLVTTQLLKKNEASYFLSHDNWVYHNNHIYRQEFLDLINFPIHEAFLVTHPDYR